MTEQLDLTNLRQNLAAAFVECGLVEPMYSLHWENTETGETGVLMGGCTCPLDDALVYRNEWMRTEWPAFYHWIEAVTA